MISSSEIYKASDGFWYFSSEDRFEKVESKPRLEIIRRIISFCVRLIAEYYGQNQTTVNYEQIYDVLFQLRNGKNKSYPNPIVLPLLRSVDDELVSRLRNLQLDLRELLNDSCEFIEDIVFQQLFRETKSSAYLDGIIELFTEFQSVVYTLNHDCLIETKLKENNIDYIDGFGTENKYYRPWKDLALSSISKSLYYIKLHGSLAWYKVGKTRRTESEILAIPNNIQQSGRFDIAEICGSKRPSILIGNISKILMYTDEFYLDLLFSFRRNLHHNNRIIVCGYGFHDQVINLELIEWLENSRNNKIILISEDELIFSENPNWEIKNNQELLSERITRIPVWVENINKNTIEEIHSIVS